MKKYLIVMLAIFTTVCFAVPTHAKKVPVKITPKTVAVNKIKPTANALKLVVSKFKSKYKFKEE